MRYYYLLKKIYVILIVVLMFFFESCQTPRSYLTSQENYVICEYRGFVPRPTKSYKKYQKFKLGAKTKELLNLSNSQNLSVKTYANWALIEKLKNGYEQIFEKILQDTSRITKLFKNDLFEF